MQNMLNSNLSLNTSNLDDTSLAQSFKFDQIIQDENSNSHQILTKTIFRKNQNLCFKKSNLLRLINRKLNRHSNFLSQHIDQTYNGEKFNFSEAKTNHILSFITKFDTDTRKRSLSLNSRLEVNFCNYFYQTNSNSNDITSNQSQIQANYISNELLQIFTRLNPQEIKNKRISLVETNEQKNSNLRNVMKSQKENFDEQVQFDKMKKNDKLIKIILGGYWRHKRALSLPQVIPNIYYLVILFY